MAFWGGTFGILLVDCGKCLSLLAWKNANRQEIWKIDVWFYWLVACGCACCWLLRIRILFVIWQFPFCLCDWQGVVNIKNKLTSLLRLAQTCRWNSWISLKRLPTSVISPLDQVAWRGNSFQISLGLPSNCCTIFTTPPHPPPTHTSMVNYQ